MRGRGPFQLIWALSCVVCCLHAEGQSREVRLLNDDLKVEPVWSNIAGAVQIEFLKSGQVLVVQKHGLIRLYESISSKQNDYTTVVDIQDKVDSHTDRGLLSVTPHQDFPTSGYFFVMFVGEPDPPNHDTCNSWGCKGINQLVRYKVTADAKEWSYDVQMLSTCQTGDSHSGGALGYDLKGNLLWAVGDLARYRGPDLGDNQRDICWNPNGLKAQGAMRSQTDDVIGGKILKVFKESLHKNFNAGHMQRGVDYVAVAKGIRNTLRMAARPGTHDLYCGDTQFDKADTVYVLSDPSDVNDIETNFGWPCIEGNAPMDDYLNAMRVLGVPQACSAALASYKPAALVMRHRQQLDMSQNEHCGSTPSNSCTGVGWYTGDKLPPAFQGHFFWADYGRACVFWAPKLGLDGSPDFSQARALSYGWADGITGRRSPDVNGVVDIKTGPDGYLYFVDFSGQQVYRLQAAADTNTPDTDTPVSAIADGIQLTLEVSGPSVTGANFTCCSPLSFRLKATDRAGNDIQPLISDVDWTMVTAHCPVDYCTGEQACHTHPLEGAVLSSDKFTGTIFPAEHELPSYVRIQAVAHYKDKLIRSFTDLYPNTHTVSVLGRSPDVGPMAQLLLYIDDFACTTQPCDGKVMADSSSPFTAPQIQAYRGEVYHFSHWEWAPQGGALKQKVMMQIFQNRFTSSGQLTAWYNKQVNVPIAAGGPLSRTPEAPILQPNYGYTGLTWNVPDGVPSNANIYTIVDCKATNLTQGGTQVTSTRSMIAQISSGTTFVELTKDPLEVTCAVYFYDYDTRTRSPKSPTSKPAVLWEEADDDSMQPCSMYVKILDYSMYHLWRTQNRVPHANIVNITQSALTLDEYVARLQDALREPLAAVSLDKKGPLSHWRRKKRMDGRDGLSP